MTKTKGRKTGGGAAKHAKKMPAKATKRESAKYPAMTGKKKGGKGK